MYKEDRPDRTTLSIPKDKVEFVAGNGYSNIRRIEKKSGAKIRIIRGQQPSAIIVGDKEQRARATNLIKEDINRAYVTPTIGFNILELDDVTDVKKAKFQFVKFEGDDFNAHSRNRVQFAVKSLKETADDSDNQEESEVDKLAHLFDQDLEISSNNEFNISNKLDDCFNEIFSQLQKADPTERDKKEIRINLFFGRQLYSCISKEVFNVNEWTKFKRPLIRTSFQHNAPQILEKLSILQEEFGFREDKEREIIKERESITIYFSQDSRGRKIKLHWDSEQNLWKVTKYVRDTNRLAILDIISGTEAPDCRFVLKTGYNLHIVSNIARIISEIQSEKSFEPKDGMWFRAKDFDEKLERVEIRQTMSKRRFFNKNFQISIVSIRQESKGIVSDQKTINLKNRSWRSIENIDNNLRLHYDEEEISNTIRETTQYAREIMKALA